VGGKPDQRIYKILCEKLNVEPKESFYFGDGNSSGLVGVLDVGMEPVLIRAKSEDD